jgi:hypothetical protein
MDGIEREQHLRRPAIPDRRECQRANQTIMIGPNKAPTLRFRASGRRTARR